jgi:hypothetical protein
VTGLRQRSVEDLLGEMIHAAEVGAASLRGKPAHTLRSKV